MSKHTPGPWAFKQHGGRIRIITADQGLTVAYTPEEQRADGWSSQANARLIAAAPEMYEALQNIVANHQVMPDQTMNNTTDVAHVPLDDIEAARAALKKAEG